MSDVRLCPACGARRMGGFRYCLGCRLDYDALGPDARLPTTLVEPSWPDPEEARQAIRNPGFGAPPVLEPAARRRRPTRGGSGGVRWITNAIASLGIVALIGVAFSSTGVSPIDAPTASRGPVAGGLGRPSSPSIVGPPTTTVGTAAAPAPPAGGPVAAPATGGTPRPARPAPRVVATPIAVTAAGTTISGGAGTATWSALSFPATEASLRWSATTDARSGCELRWTLADAAGRVARGRLRVGANGKQAGHRTLKVKRGAGRLVVTTDCGSWSLVVAAKRA